MSLKPLGFILRPGIFLWARPLLQILVRYPVSYATPPGSTYQPSQGPEEGPEPQKVPVSGALKLLMGLCSPDWLSETPLSNERSNRALCVPW